MKSFFTVLLKFSPVFLLAGLMHFKGRCIDRRTSCSDICELSSARIVCKIKLQDSLDSAMKSVSNILIALFTLTRSHTLWQVHS